MSGSEERRPGGGRRSSTFNWRSSSNSEAKKLERLERFGSERPIVSRASTWRKHDKERPNPVGEEVDDFGFVSKGTDNHPFTISHSANWGFAGDERSSLFCCCLHTHADLYHEDSRTTVIKSCTLPADSSAATTNTADLQLPQAHHAQIPRILRAQRKQ
jgi:hypothetical protein